MRLSVITINYNNAPGLKKTLDSAAAQTSSGDVEFIVVDGGSSDGSKALISAHSGLLASWVSERDSGIYNAMNKGVKMACGDYCLFMNSGDAFHSPEVLEKAIPLLDGTEIITGRYMLMDSGELTSIEEPLTMLRFYTGSLPHQATFIRRDLLLADPYDESLRIVADWKLFMKKTIVENLPYKFVDLVVADYDCHGVSSTDAAQVQKERDRVYAELFPPRIMADYLRFVKGSSYSDTTYDRFFIELRNFDVTSRFIYKLDWLVVKAMSLFKKRLRFVRNLPF